MKKAAAIILLFGAVGISVLLLSPGNRNEPRILWEINLNANWASAPAIGRDGTLYFGDLDGNLCAVTRNGSVRWKTPLPVVGTRADVVSIAANGTIYNVTSAGELVAFGPEGRVRWSVSVGILPLNSISLGPENVIYAVSKTNHLHAFNPDGSLRWEFHVPKERTGNLAVGPGNSLYFLSETNLRILSGEGTLKRIFTNVAYYSNLPVIAPDGTIYVQAFTNFCAITPNGHVKWSVNNYGGQDSAILDSGSTLYVCGHDGVRALEASTGKQLWKHPTVPMTFSGLAVGNDGTIYFSGGDSSIHALDRHGKLKWSFRREPYTGARGVLLGLVNWFRGWGKRGKPFYPCGFTLAEEPRLYAIMPDRKLYALEVSAGLDTNAPWPMFRHDVRHSGAAATQQP